MDDFFLYQIVGAAVSGILAGVSLPPGRPDDDVEVVVDRLHPGEQLLLHLTGEVAEVLTHGDNGSGDHDLLVPLGRALLVSRRRGALIDAGGQGEQGFAGAGPAGEGDDVDFACAQGVEGALLFHVPGRDPHERPPLLDLLPGVGAGDPLEPPRALPVLDRTDPLAAFLFPYDQSAALEDGGLVGAVVLRLDAEGLGLDPDGRVLGDQHHRVGVVDLEAHRREDDDVVRQVRLPPEGAVPPVHPQGPPARQRHPLREVPFLAKGIDQVKGVPNRLGDLPVASLESVELGDHLKGKNDLVVFELQRGLGIMNKDVGVQNICFPHFYSLRGRLSEVIVFVDII